MNAEPQVFLRGKSRARIIPGSGRGPAEARAIEKWLTGRSDVVRFERRKSTGEFDVDYDDGDDLHGHFLRSLRHKLHTLKRPEPFDVQPVHSLPGRVRVKVTGIRPEQLAALTLLVG